MKKRPIQRHTTLAELLGLPLPPGFPPPRLQRPGERRAPLPRTSLQRERAAAEALARCIRKEVR